MRSGAGVCRGVGAERDIDAGEEPVVRGVLEDVAQGHGGGGEAMDEHGLKLALEEVQRDHRHGEGLGGGRRGEWVRGRGRVRIEDVGAEEVEERVDEERPQIFDYKDGVPWDLWACEGLGLEVSYMQLISLAYWFLC